MKFFYPQIALIFLMIFSSAAVAQQNCLPIEETSEILLNLKLGMTVGEVNQKFGSLKIKIKNDKEYRFFQNFIDKKPPFELNRVRALYLRFLGKKLYQIEIFYDENAYPADIKTLTEVVSNQLNLPVSEWKFANRQAVLTCGEISLTVDYQLNPRVELTDETIKKQIAEMNKKK